MTGTTRFSSSQTWVMPTFSPTIAFGRHGVRLPVSRSRERSARASPAERRSGCACRFLPAGPTRTSVAGAAPGPDAARCGFTGAERSSDARRRLSDAEARRPGVPGGGDRDRRAERRSGAIRLGLLDLDLDVDAGRQLEALQRVDGLGRSARGCRAGACGCASRSARGSPCPCGASGSPCSGASRSAAGTGPRIVAWVRTTVSTIFFVDWSMISWS